MKNTKRIIAFLLAVVMMLALAACGKDNSDNNKDNPDANNNQGGNEVVDVEAIAGDAVVNYKELQKEENIDTSRKSTYNSDERHEEITVYINSEITSFTPWQGGRGRSAMILEIWEPLYYYNDGFELEACLAKGMEWVDETHLNVEIYDYIEDYKGNHLTADDVVFCFENLLAQGGSLDYYKGIEAISDYVVQFTFGEEIHDDLDALPSALITLLYTEEAYNSYDFASEPVGTGAYYLESMIQGSTYHFAANENYWQKDESLRCSQAGQNLDGFTAMYIGDSSVAYMSFTSGDVFNYSEISSTNLPDVLPGGKYENQFAVGYEYMTGRYGLSFNMSGVSVVDDINLRLAICYAINSDDIVYALGENSVYATHAESGMNTIGYQDIWDTTYQDTYYGICDLELAKEYLKKSDYNNETLRLISISRGEQQQACQIIVEVLKSIGINVEYIAAENAILDSYIRDFEAFDLYFYNWNGEALSQQWQRQLDLNAYVSSNTHDGVTYNDFCLHDEKLQEYVEKVQLVSQATDELYQEIQQYIQDNAYLYSLFGKVQYNAYNSDLAMMVSTNGHKDTMWGACEYYLD